MQNDTTPPKPQNNTLDPQARRNARRYALQAMYQWQLSGAPINEIEFQFLTTNIDRKTDVDYFKMLLHGVPANLDTIDEAIKPYLTRAFGDIDPIELAILRLATHELMERPDVPYRVVINEALELAKKFGSVEGYKFVNGMLDKIAKKLRDVEVKAYQDGKL